ncbi:MAG: NUDIX domain-containing protein [Candidatus Aenigmarchaeota archaeon]|nr:NUDIX domain-containing protein [Candidatus Aenigmarchaeota archaeon]
MGTDFLVVAQKAVIREGDKYLIMRRSTKTHVYPGYWDFPGGRLEIGEDVLKALEREVLEETGFKIRVIKPIFTFHEIVNERPVFFIVYQCEKISGEFRLSEEHTEHKWATKEEILKLEKTENFLKAFLRRE